MNDDIFIALSKENEGCLEGDSTMVDVQWFADGGIFEPGTYTAMYQNGCFRKDPYGWRVAKDEYFVIVNDMGFTQLAVAPAVFGEYETEEAAISANTNQFNSFVLWSASKIGLMFVGPTEGNENSPNYGGPNWCIVLDAPL